MKKLILIAASLVVLAGCTDPEGARRAVEDAGYTEVEIGGYSFFGCSEDDQFRTSFTARSPNTNREVRGVVCKGIFKGSTIRIH